MKNYKKFLAMTALIPSLLFGTGQIKAGELEQKISEPIISIDVNYTRSLEYKIKSEQTTDYSVSQVYYFNFFETLLTPSGIPELTFDEKIQVENIMVDMQNKNIESYQDLVENSSNLSEKQKLILLSAVGYSLAVFNWDIDLSGDVISQSEFFDNLQDSLSSSEKNPVGVCRHIASHIEQLANDIGIKAAAVSGISKNGVGHAYNILKTDTGNSIIDYGAIFITNTKNIAKTLKAYQKHRGMTTFQHLFFEDTEFEYRLITEDGRNFLDLVGYDESSDPLKNSLIHNAKVQSDLTIAVNLEDYLTSFEINYFGIFAKYGNITGSHPSPLEKINLFQAGFKRNFPISDNMRGDCDISFMRHQLSQDSELENSQGEGISGNLIINTNYEKGFNFSSRIAGNIFTTNGTALFNDFILGGGASYSIPIKNINIKPYIVSQFSMFPKDIGTYKFVPKLTELASGIVFDMELNNTNFSIEPYYTKKIWEQEFGGNIALEGKHVGINAGGYIAQSDYDFCPDKHGINVGASLNLGNLKLIGNYQREGTNYDGEKENDELFKIRASVKF